MIVFDGFVYTYGDLVSEELALGHFFNTDPGSGELELQVLWHNNVDAID